MDVPVLFGIVGAASIFAGAIWYCYGRSLDNEREGLAAISFGSMLLVVYAWYVA